MDEKMVEVALDEFIKEQDEWKCKYEVPKEMPMPKILFKPRLLSLGPIHHGLPELQAMEEYKKRYATNFLRRSQRPGEAFFHCIEESVTYLFGEYHGANIPDIFRHDLRMFIEMMITDGAFLIEFLLRLHSQQWEEEDRMSQKKWTLLKFDILSLENQLPMLLLERLFDVSGLKTSSPSIENLIETFLVQSELLWNKDVTRRAWLIEVRQTQKFHILAMLPFCFGLPRARDETKHVLSLPSSPTISKLYRVGVKFRSSYRGEVELKLSYGILRIPTLVIDENTERLFANLLAFEMCTKDVHNVSDYVAMMDFLIDSPEDIKILVNHGIIKNFLKDDEAASNLINYLGRNIAIYDNFGYSVLVEKLNKYCMSTWAKWQAEVFEWKMDLKQNYIGNPWKLLSVI